METPVAGRYRPLRELGRGAAGVVWLCEDEVLRRDVAVKRVGLLPGESTHDAARAVREARSSAALQHPAVVTVFDVVEEDDQAWLVMEHVPSRPLSQVVAEEGPLAPRRAAAIAAQVAGGLAAAHREGTVHRDVKPGNVLVTDDDTAKISDFGIARTGGDDQLTRAGLVVGTPAYFSPELARGGDPTPASDVWALGATLHAMVEGRPPYPPSDNALAQLGRIATEPVPRSERAGPLAPVLAAMMEPDPERRITMDEAERRLLAVAAGSAAAPTAPTALFAAPPPAPPAGDPGPQVAAPDRRRRPVPVALAVLLLGLLGVAATAAALTLSGPDDRTSQVAPRDPGAEPRAGAAGSPRASSPSAAPSSSPSAPPEGRQPTPAEREAGARPRRPAQAAPPAARPTPEPAPAPADFVRDYYAMLPERAGAAWELLGRPIRLRVGSYEDYAGFWDTVEAVEVIGTSPAGDRAVDTSLSYTTPDGRSSEVRRIELARRGDGWVIVGDAVVG